MPERVLCRVLGVASFVRLRHQVRPMSARFRSPFYHMSAPRSCLSLCETTIACYSSLGVRFPVVSTFNTTECIYMYGSSLRAPLSDSHVQCMQTCEFSRAFPFSGLGSADGRPRKPLPSFPSTAPQTPLHVPLCDDPIAELSCISAAVFSTTLPPLVLL